MQYADQMAKLSDEHRLHFYEVLAHNLTVAIRGVWSDVTTNDTEKVDRMKWINELLHRVTAKVYVLRLHTHEWTEADFGELIVGTVHQNEGITVEVFNALNRSYFAVTGNEMG